MVVLSNGEVVVLSRLVVVIFMSGGRLLTFDLGRGGVVVLSWGEVVVLSRGRWWSHPGWEVVVLSRGEVLSISSHSWTDRCL